MKRPVRLSKLFITLGFTFALHAEALTLGKLSVLSSLGQPLIAEIEVPEISSDEANSIRVGLASPEAYKSAGLDYTTDIPQITVVGKRRTDGRAILELRSTKPISAPYLDVVLEVTWNTGRMLRDYTVLLDPPAAPSQPLITPAQTLPIQSMSPAQNVLNTPNAADVSAPVTPRAVAAPPAPVVASSSPTPAIATTPRQARQPASRMTVKKGDTAAAIAMANKPEGVSLDQMLVAMLGANPDAFINGNVNRLKAGAVIGMPSTVDAGATDAKTARANIQVQARDFNEYRRKLAANIGTTIADGAAQTASGKVTAKVTDQKQAAAKDDRLTLAKPTDNKAATSVETKIAQDRAAAETKARAAELQKNIAELSKLVPVAAPVTSTATQPAMTASGAAPTTAPAVVAPLQATPTTPAPLPPMPARPLPPPIEQSALDQIIMSPLTLPIASGVGLLVLLASWLGIKRRRNAAFGNSEQTKQNFAETRQPSDTIFGPMGASDVDTKESAVSTTMVYSASQLAPQTTGGVDPIAEADVYLAYNRDVQAEEILKAAKAENPKRTDIQVKLLELYAKRRDIDAFDSGAEHVHQITNGLGEDWQKVTVLAKEVGSLHSLFQPKQTEAAPPFASTMPNFAPTTPSFSSTATPAFAASTGFGNTKPSDPPVSVAPANTGLIDFDMSHFSLNIPETQPLALPATAPSASEDPKLALAEEYLSIGDRVGARSLIEQVIEQSPSPQVVTLAHQMLAKLG